MTDPKTPHDPIRNTADTDRDDRTLRLLSGILGDNRAEDALSHFLSRSVTVLVSGNLLETENVSTSVTSLLNMLSRFVGSVQLCVVGMATESALNRVDLEIREIHKINTVHGRSISRISELPADALCRVIVGLSTGDEFRTEQDIHVSFDSWSCTVRRGQNAGDTAPSRVTIGGLCAASFAAAEVFKSFVAHIAPRERIEEFKRRFTRDFSFSAWKAERIEYWERADIEAIAPVLEITLHARQIGAGAVGNGVLLVMSSCQQLSALLPVVDSKLVSSTNLNRCYYFSEADVGAPKAEVVGKRASRPGFQVVSVPRKYTTDDSKTKIVVSTVDNNEVRHAIQEDLPPWLVQGSTGSTTIAVSVHRPLSGRSCLVCRHPDRDVGSARQVALSLADAAGLTGLTETEISEGRVKGSLDISDDLIARVAISSREAASLLQSAKERGLDLCGGLGGLRLQLGTTVGPEEASIPFVSNLAGILAAAEVIKISLSSNDDSIPILDNVLELDLLRDYSRAKTCAFNEPPRSDCKHCQLRETEIKKVIEQRIRQGASP